MELRFMMLWRYFTQKTYSDQNAEQHLQLKIRALSPLRRKIVDHLGVAVALLSIAGMLVWMVPLILLEEIPLYALILPLVVGGCSYVVSIMLLIVFLRKTKTIIIDGQHLMIRRYMFFWSYFDRTRSLAIIERDFSPLSHKELAEELLREGLEGKGKTRPAKPYYKCSRHLIIEHRGIPYSLMSIYDLGLSEQIRCRLQAALDEIPVGGNKKITASPVDTWGRQAGDLEITL